MASSTDVVVIEEEAVVANALSGDGVVETVGNAGLTASG